jgi:hypothetical protein
VFGSFIVECILMALQQSTIGYGVFHSKTEPIIWKGIRAVWVIAAIVTPLYGFTTAV